MYNKVSKNFKIIGPQTESNDLSLNPNKKYSSWVVTQIF